MLIRITRSAVIALLLPIAVAQAEPPEQLSRPQAVEPVTSGGVRLPGTGYTVDLDSLRSQRGAALGSPDLLKAIVRWLSIQFELPATDDLPALEIAPPAKITTFAYTGLLSDRPEDVARVPEGSREVVAAYDAATRTIYLPEGWSGATPVELSMLVHEMVHHLQRSAHIGYGCQQERERLAYAAQAKWLALFGRQLYAEFDLDPLTVAMLSTCLYY